MKYARALIQAICVKESKTTRALKLVAPVLPKRTAVNYFVTALAV